MDRHDGKKLLHGPAIGHALEERKIAEVSIGKKAVETFELLREVIELLAELLDVAADLPIDALRHAALHQGQIAEAEQVQSGIERLLGIVKTFEQVLIGEALQRFLKIDQRLLDIVGDF